MKSLLILATVAAIAAGAHAQMSYQTFSNMQRVAGVSRDGSVIVFDAGPRVFRWTANGGYQVVHSTGWGRHETYAVSGDAGTLLGTYAGKFLQGRYRWSLAGGLVDGPFGAAVSFDGSVTVGNNGSNPVKWIGTSDAISLTTLSGSASAVSDDGNTIFGNVNVGGVSRLFRWRSTTGLDILNAPTSNTRFLQASADGRAAVGLTTGPSGVERAFLWTTDAGFQLIPQPADLEGVSEVVISPCGTVVAGRAASGSLGGAFYWTATTGSVMLRQAFYDAGVWPLMSLRPPQTVTAVQVVDGNIRLYGSATGNVSWMPQAYVATVVPEPATLLGLGGLMAGTFIKRRRHRRGDADNHSKR